MNVAVTVGRDGGSAIVPPKPSNAGMQSRFDLDWSVVVVDVANNEVVVWPVQGAGPLAFGICANGVAAEGSVEVEPPRHAQNKSAAATIATAVFKNE